MFALLIGAAASAAICVNHAPQGQWKMGHFNTAPISSALTPRLAQQMERRGLKEITAHLAKSLAGDATLPFARHYYVTRAVFYGNEGDLDRLPQGVRVSVDVQSSGVAYLQSYRLTSQTRLSTAPIILISDSPLTGVVAMCGAAI